MTAFSVLLPVYAGDEPEYFARALGSVSTDQQLRPSEIVIVRDGPVPMGLSRVLARAVDGDAVSGVPVTVVRSATNQGLARALSLGLDACRHEIVARADADDISLPERFAAQLPVITGAGSVVAGSVAAVSSNTTDGFDVVGSAIQEFSLDEHEPGIVRVLPSSGDEIRRMARFRDPFNHPTVVFRRTAVEAAGGYQHLAKMEDYWLFARMLRAGARVTNLPEPLVLYRVGAGAYNRRGGLDMLRSEIELQNAFLATGFVDRATWARNIVVRGLYRLVPTGIRQPAYRLMQKVAGKRG